MSRPSTLLLYSAPKSGFGDEWMTFLPIGLGFLQAMLASRGFPCRLANLSGKGRKEILDYLRRRRPRVIGVSMFTFNRKRSCDLLQLAREACPEALLLAGGPHPTHLAGEVFEDCPALDAIVKGEGELPLLGMLERLEARARTGAPAPGLILRAGETASRAAHGGPGPHGRAGGAFRRRISWTIPASSPTSAPAGAAPPPAISATPRNSGAAACASAAPRRCCGRWSCSGSRHGLTYYSFRDDTFTANRTRILALMDLIRGSDLHPLWNCQSRVNLVDEDRLVAMKRAGCEFMQFGVEHGSERVLELLDKGTSMKHALRALSLVRKVGMNLGIYLITGIPGEHWEDVEITADLIRDDPAPRRADLAPGPVPRHPAVRPVPPGGPDQQGFLPGHRGRGDLRPGGRPHREGPAPPGRGERPAPAPGPSTAPRSSPSRRSGWVSARSPTCSCGEAAEEAGRPMEAEAEYAEVIRREPGNPWGFLKRALLAPAPGPSRRGPGRPGRSAGPGPGQPRGPGTGPAMAGQGRKGKPGRPGSRPTGPRRR